MIDKLIRKPVRKGMVYDKMLSEIKQAILGGKLPPQSRILSEPELCERYGISRVSVRTALAKLEKNGLIVKKNGLGSFVCDPGNPAFAPPQEFCDIAVNLTEVNLNAGWYYSKIYNAAAAAAPRNNVKLSFVNEVTPRIITPAHWNGLLALNLDCNREIEEIAGNGIQVILFNRMSHHPDIASVYVDYFEEAYKAVRYLQERGHRKITLMSAGEGGSSATIFRVGGYLKAVGRSFPEPELFCSLAADRPDAEYTAAILEYLKNYKPDAVFIPFGAQFLPFAAAANKLKIRIPEDMEVISFDDVGDMRNFCGFPFGYIKMPLAEMTTDAIEYLVRRISQKDSCPVMKRKYDASLEFSE